MPISVTRTLLSAALSGQLGQAEYRTDPVWNVEVPAALSGIDPEMLDPRQTWKDRSAFDRSAQKLRTLVEAELQALGIPAIGQKELQI